MMGRKRKLFMAWAMVLIVIINEFIPINVVHGSDIINTSVLTDFAAEVTQDGTTIPEGNTITSTKPIHVDISFGVPVVGDDPAPTVPVRKGDTVKFELSNAFKLLSRDSMDLKMESLLVGHVTFVTDPNTKMVIATVTFDGDDSVFDGTSHTVTCQFGADFEYDGSGTNGKDGNHTIKILEKTYTMKDSAKLNVRNVKKTSTDTEGAEPQSAVQLTDTKAASIMGTDYVAGNADVSGMSLKQEDSNYTVKNNSSTPLLVTTGFALKPDSDYSGFTKATVSYEFMVRRYFTGSSGGNVSFNSSDYSWLNNVKISVVNIDGAQYWKLTGTRTLTADQLIPGQSQETITARVSDAKNSDKFTVSARAWLTLDGETAAASATSDTFTVAAAIDGRYDLACQSANNGVPVISGYYNPTTHAFYTTETAKDTAGDTDAVYGRFYYFATRLFPKDSSTVGTEMLKTASWDMQYAVTVDNSGNKTTLASTDKYAPILVDVKRSLITTDNKGFINGTDMTMGGNVNINADSSLYTSAASTVYTGSDSNGTASVSVDLSPAPGYAAGTRSLFFVPTDPNDTVSTKRTLTVTLTDCDLTGQTDLKGTDSVTTNNTYTYVVARKVSGTGEGMSQSFIKGSMLVSAGGTYGIITNLSYPSASLANTEITAANVLVKLDTSGLTFTGNYTTGTFGGNASTKRIFACKPDGSAWTDDSEMFTTRAKDLVYYDKLSDVPSGWKVVGLLYEFRNGLLSNNSFNITSDVKANSIGSYAMALDSETWFSNNDNNATYSGTNGGARPVMKAPSQAIYSSNGGTYIKTQWSGSGTITTQDPNKSTYGCTLKASGYVMLNGSASILNGTNPRDPVPSVAESGGVYSVSNYSSFNISDGNRLIAASGTFAIFWNGSGDDPKTAMRLKISRFSGNSKFQQVGNVYMAPTDAKVTWNDTTQSFESSDSRFKKIDPNDFTITGAGQYVFYYNLHIGDETDLSKDVSTGTYALSFGIARYPETTEILQMPNVRYNDVNFYGERGCNIDPVITKSSVVGLAKVALDSVVSPGENIGYSLASNSLKAVIPNYSMLDVLPFNNDGRGSVINGDYKLANNALTMTLSTSESAIGSNFTVYYTTDPAVRKAGIAGKIPDASQVDASTFKPSSTLGVTWKAMMKTVDTLNSTASKSVINYSIQAEDADSAPTAIVMVGTFGKNEQYYIKMNFETNDNHCENTYVNNASIDSPVFLNHPITSAICPVQVVHKIIDGTAWFDADNDGLMGSGEEKLSGIKVHLHQADGTEVKQDAYGNAYGTVITNANGYYCFNNMPDNTDGWYVTFELTKEQAHDYSLTAYHVSDASDKTVSDFRQSTNIGTKTVSNATAVFKMLTYTQQGENNQLNAKTTNNLGFVSNYPVTWEAAKGGSVSSDGATEQVGYNSSPTKDVTVNGTAGESEFNGIWNIETYDAATDTWISTGTTTDYKSLIITAPTKLIAQLRTFPSVAITGTKTLTGGGKTTADIKANQFSFTVTRTDNEKGNVTGLPTTAVFAAGGSGGNSHHNGNGDSAISMLVTGTLDFGSWTFDAAGTYTFTISENDVPAGYTKASDVTVTVAVFLNSDGTAYETGVSYSSGDTLTFTNTYTYPDSIPVGITGIKTLTGAGKTNADIKKNQFYFTVVANGDNPENGVTGLPTSSVGTAVGGDLDFGTWVFSKTGTYNFTITENDLKNTGYTFDQSVYGVEIIVTFNEQTNKLDAETAITKDGKNVEAIVFNNNYTPIPVTNDFIAKKVVNGTPPSASDFTFTLTAEDPSYPMPEGGVKGVKKITRTGAGEVDFGKLTFTDTGTYVYSVTEMNTGLKNYTYDTTNYTLTYVVKDNNGTLEVVRTITAKDKTFDTATFTNTYKVETTPADPIAPLTGDNSNIPLGCTAMILSSLVLCICFIIRKKKEKSEG